LQSRKQAVTPGKPCLCDVYAGIVRRVGQMQRRVILYKAGRGRNHRVGWKRHVMHAVQGQEGGMEAAQLALAIPMCAAVGKRDRKSAELLQEPGMAGKPVAGWLEIAEDERLDIGCIPALLQELGLDGVSQETAVVVLRCGLLCLYDGRKNNKQDYKQKPHNTNVGSKRRMQVNMNG